MKHLKAILVGYGNMGKNWREVLTHKRNVEIVGVVDVSETNTLQAQADLNLTSAQVSSDIAELIDRVKSDFIIDCSAPNAHFSNTTTALNHGCDILGEKPIASSLSEAQKIIELAKQKRKLYMVNQNYRWRPIMIVLKEYLRSGALGKIQTINILHAQNFVFKDTFRYQINNPFLLDMAVHHFDVVRSLTDANFETVYCIESNPKDANFKSGSSASAIFTFANGVIFTYQGSWSEIGQSTSFMGSWRIACEKGTIIWDGSGNPQVEYKTDSGLITKELQVPESNVMKSDNVFLHELETSLDHFLDGLYNNKVPETWCGDNIHTLDMVLSAIESSEKRMVIAASHKKIKGKK